MKRLLRDYIVAVGSYVGLIALGLVLTLTVSSAVGYLPYSDRPGPGWVEPFFSFGLLGFYLSWAVLLLLPTAIYGTVIFVWLRLLHVFETPMLIVRVAGALSAAFVAFIDRRRRRLVYRASCIPDVCGRRIGRGVGGFHIATISGPSATFAGRRLTVDGHRYPTVGRNFRPLLDLPRAALHANARSQTGAHHSQRRAV